MLVVVVVLKEVDVRVKDRMDDEMRESKRERGQGTRDERV